MLGSAIEGALAYTHVEAETGETAPGLYQLIAMLFDGALAAVTQAKQHMLNANAPAKGQAIWKAVGIITGGLRASLVKPENDDIAGDLDALYGHLCNRLILANLRCQPELLDEVHGLLQELKQAWELAEAGDKRRYKAFKNALRSDTSCGVSPILKRRS